MPLIYPDSWGLLRGRYQAHRPRRMLSLDGGGIKGIITLQVLKKLEDDLRGQLGRGANFRLSDFFDYVGGTSTGAIIAAAIARGLTIDEISEFYESFGRQVFRRRIWGPGNRCIAGGHWRSSSRRCTGPPQH